MIACHEYQEGMDEKLCSNRAVTTARTMPDSKLLFPFFFPLWRATTNVNQVNVILTVNTFVLTLKFESLHDVSASRLEALVK